MKNSVLLVDYYYRCILRKEPPLSAEKIPILATSKSNGDVITDQPAVVTDTVSNISYYIHAYYTHTCHSHTCTVVKN